ncbi:hypothetical protein FSW04_16215 [Baekduia soli]|uniref:Uncharacterized protein n=1 Tax=Baekduia soli TaxID=496014 RepID=A0A5B8U799_9ACTN|nr:hypothetical protein [Baekduia soli]QEC48964.1 hypothetical protein FSW04_16215 [Baekduia soli]
MSVDRRDQLVKAVHASDWHTIDALGWHAFFADLAAFWPRKLTSDHALAYARVLGGHDPVMVTAALAALAETGQAEYRPGPAQLAAAIARTGTGAKTNATPKVGRPDQHPITLGRVRDLLGDGHQICGCVGPRQFNQNAGGVMRCAKCHGIEQGQADNALEQLDEEAA